MAHFPEDTARKVDAYCKIAGTAALILGGLFGLVKYLQARNDEIEVRQEETQKAALDERLRICVDLTTATSKVATADNPEELKQAKKEFHAISLGPLGLVENGMVDNAATKFSVCADNPKSCVAPIQELSREVALACRASLGPNWGFREPNPPVLSIKSQ